MPVLEAVPGFHVFDAATGRRRSSAVVPTLGLITDLAGVCCAAAVVPAASPWSLAVGVVLLGLVGLGRLRWRYAGS